MGSPYITQEQVHRGMFEFYKIWKRALGLGEDDICALANVSSELL